MTFVKAKAKRLGKIILYALGGLILIVVVLMPVVKGVYQYQAKKATGGITDTTVLDYEAYSAALSNLIYIYGVYDSTSYSEAMSKCDISDSLRTSFFPTSEYTGAVMSKPTVNILSTEYEISDDTTTRLYYVVLELERDDTTKYYKILAEVQDSSLIDFRILGVV
jgi:hypothetical protein